MTLARAPTHGHQRHADDWYVEPEAVTDALLDVERFVGLTWDPACGGGNIPGTFLRRRQRAIGSDKVDRGADAVRHGWTGIVDFLAEDVRLPPGVVNIATNPPFYRARGTEAFIRTALRLVRGKVAIFAPLGFLASGRRARGLFAECRPHRVWILADRPSCAPGDYIQSGGDVGGGTVDFAWCVWDVDRPQARITELCWFVGPGDGQGSFL